MQDPSHLACAICGTARQPAEGSAVSALNDARLQVPVTCSRLGAQLATAQAALRESSQPGQSAASGQVLDGQVLCWTVSSLLDCEGLVAADTLSSPPVERPIRASFQQCTFRPNIQQRPIRASFQQCTLRAGARGFLCVCTWFLDMPAAAAHVYHDCCRSLILFFGVMLLLCATLSNTTEPVC